MPGIKPIKLASWQWFRDELVRRLGQAESDALFAELARLRLLEATAKQKKLARGRLAYFEQQRDERHTQGRPTKRIDNAIAHWRALLED